MTQLINLTPHPINLLIGYKEITLESEGTVRLKEEIENIGDIELEGTKIPVIRKKLFPETELPEKKEGVYYIVSLAVAQAFPEREDLLVIGESVRDEQGNIIGAKSLARV